MNKQLRPALVLFLLLTIVTGIAYPLATTAIGKVAFPAQAAGSIIQKDGKAIGSELIGQNFTAPEYFWGRPSATGPYPNNAAASSGSNLGPLNPALSEAVKARVEALKVADPDNALTIPVDLVTASASGLDPHISPAAAQYQASRIARARHVDIAKVNALIAQQTQGRQIGLLGEARVNVLKLNLALDGLAQAAL